MLGQVPDLTPLKKKKKVPDLTYKVDKKAIKGLFGIYV